MQANEVLGNFELALTDCKAVLILDPKNTEANQANQRLSNRIAGKGNFIYHVSVDRTRRGSEFCLRKFVQMYYETSS